MTTPGYIVLMNPSPIKRKSTMAKKRKSSSNRHRVSIRKAGKGKSYAVSARSPFSKKRGVTITNPAKRHKTRKKGFLRSNPGKIGKAFSMDAILNVLSVAVGGVAAIYLLPKVIKLAPASVLGMAQKYQGGIALVGGLAGQHFVKHPKAKAALLGVAGIGGIDLVARTVGGSFVTPIIPTLAGWDIPQYLEGMPEVGGEAPEIGADFEMGGQMDAMMSEMGQGMDWSLSGLDLTV